MDLPTFEQAQSITKEKGCDVLFEQDGKQGVMRFRDGNWYWVSVETLKKLRGENKLAA